VDLLRAGRGLARAGDGDRLARVALGIGEDAVQHLELGETGEDGRAFRGRLVGDQLDGPASRDHRLGRVAGRATDLRQPLVEKTEPDTVRAGVQPPDRGLQIRRRPGRAPDGKGGVGCPDLQIHAIDPVSSATIRRPVGRERESRLQCLELVRGGVPGLGECGGRDRGHPRTPRIEGRQPVPGGRAGPVRERARERGVVACPRDRQQVLGDRLADRSMAERQLFAVLDEEPALECLVQAGVQVGVERPGAGARTGHGARRGPLGAGLERGRDRRELPSGQWSFGEREQPHDPAALARSDRKPRDHELLERLGERCVGQLPPGGQECLRDERQPAGSLGDEEQQAGRRAFAFDTLDQHRELVPIERREVESAGRTRTVDDGREIGLPRIVAAHDIRLLRADDREPLLVRDPGKERDQGTGRGVREMEVLDDEHDRAPGAQPPEEPQHPFERSRLTPLGGGRPGTGRQRADLIEARREIGQEPDDLGRRRTERLGESVGREVAKRGPDRPDDRPVRLIDPGRPGRGA
jgi:hypothetical protein